MLFFLRSWRKAVVVMIAVPASFLVTLAVMQVLGFTLDTVSLLGMTLMIGILVDDSIVVLENISRHQEEGEAPKEAAINGISEIGVATIVITLVIVVVFLPLSFLPGQVGLFLREFGLVVTVATLTSLFVSFAVTPALAGRWALFSNWKPWGIIDRFTTWFDGVRMWYAQRALNVGFGTIAGWWCGSRSSASSSRYCSFRWASSASNTCRRSIAVSCSKRSTIRRVRRLRPRRLPCVKAEQVVLRSPDVQSETSISGAYRGRVERLH